MNDIDIEHNEDLGCPHCGKTCDVCVTLDETAANSRQLLKVAVDLLREAHPHVAYRIHEPGAADLLERIAQAIHAQ